jgi:hypothetical protein
MIEITTFAYPLKYLRDTIENFLDGYTEEDLDVYIFENVKPYYAYIINSSMTDIDLAFITSDMSKVYELSHFSPNSPEVSAFVDWDEEMTDEEREAYAEQLHQDGIDIICDEDGGLTYIGEALVLNTPLSEIVANIDPVDDLGLDSELLNGYYPASFIKDYILDKYKDTNIYKDLYINDLDNRPIFVVKKDYWRF